VQGEVHTRLHAWAEVHEPPVGAIEGRVQVCGGGGGGGGCVCRSRVCVERCSGV
jgi:hypothetical protein